MSETTDPIVVPTRTDPDLAAASNVIGGPWGKYANFNASWWTPIKVLIALAGVSYILGYLLDASCRKTGWAQPQVFEHLCYSDIPPLYAGRGFADGFLPYIQTMPGGQPLEYPVITGIFMWIAAIITSGLKSIVHTINASTTFFDVNVVLLFIAFVVTVVATAKTVRRRPWDAAMVALAPTMILAATINWDLLALALSGVAILLWSRKHEFWAGIFLGLAIASKFYPIVMLGPFLLLCWRAKKMPEFGRLVAGTVIAWLVVNIPFMIAGWDGWKYFYSFSQTRGEDFGSMYFAMTELNGVSIPASKLNVVATGLLIVFCIGIAILILKAPRRPRLAAMLFLVVAAFAVTNKVYSPQYVLWLVPLAAMARPKWRDFLIWQAGELVYFAAIWWFLVGYNQPDNKGLSAQWYGAAIWVHVIATAFFAYMVVRDALNPEFDPIRTDGQPDDTDDPGGGCLDHAPDRNARTVL